MGTDKRERKKANRQAKLEAEQAAEARRRRNRFIRNAIILAIAIVVVGLLMSGCGSSDDTASTTTAAKGSTTTTAADGDVTDDYSDQTPKPATFGTGACPPAEAPATPVIDFDAAPKRCIEDGTTYTAVVTTSEGTAEVELDTKAVPVTANNFIVLARYGYFDGTKLFRTEAQSGIIQGGSPHTQDNVDPGPGYTIPDEGGPYTTDDYGPGTLAMARTSEPNSAGSQFFFLANEGGRYLGDTAQLGPSAGTYVPFGKVTKGLDVLQKIAALDDGSSAPSKPVTITSVRIREA